MGLCKEIYDVANVHVTKQGVAPLWCAILSNEEFCAIYLNKYVQDIDDAPPAVPIYVNLKLEKVNDNGKTQDIDNSSAHYMSACIDLVSESCGSFKKAWQFLDTNGNIMFIKQKFDKKTYEKNKCSTSLF